MKTSIRRCLAALVTVCAVIVSTAGPAPAVAQTATITGGTLVVTKPGQPTLTLPLAAAGGCPTGALGLDTTSGATGTIAMTSASGKILYAFGGGANTHVVVIALGTGTTTPGTYDHGTGWMSGLTVPISARMYKIMDESTCTESGLVCSIGARISMVSGDFSSHTTSSTPTIYGSTLGGLTLTGSCGAPYSAYVGGALAVNGMTLHLT